MYTMNWCNMTQGNWISCIWHWDIWYMHWPFHICRVQNEFFKSFKSSIIFFKKKSKSNWNESSSSSWVSPGEGGGVWEMAEENHGPVVCSQLHRRLEFRIRNIPSSLSFPQVCQSSTPPSLPQCQRSSRVSLLTAASRELTELPLMVRQTSIFYSK